MESNQETELKKLDSNDLRADLPVPLSSLGILEQLENLGSFDPRSKLNLNEGTSKSYIESASGSMEFNPVSDVLHGKQIQLFKKQKQLEQLQERGESLSALADIICGMKELFDTVSLEINKHGTEVFIRIEHNVDNAVALIEVGRDDLKKARKYKKKVKKMKTILKWILGLTLAGLVIRSVIVL